MNVRKQLIAGNWKMNLDHLQALTLVQQIAWGLKDKNYDPAQTEIAIFPPFTDLRSVQTIIDADKLAVSLGAQDVSERSEGAYTGDIAARFLHKLGVQYVICGHSERRSLHAENDATVGQKSAAAIENGMVPVICVGETAADLEEFGAAAVPLQQLEAALEHVPDQAEIVIAYEPVWAIGSGKAATAAQAQEVAAALRQKLFELRGSETAEKTRILYGGSVKSDNIATYMAQTDIDGALVGGASLKADEFVNIVVH